MAQASNCKTYISGSECETCEENFGIKEDNGVLSCVMINKSNCDEIEQNSPYNCVKCASKYYLDENGDCLIATPEITNCLYYQSKEFCS